MPKQERVLDSKAKELLLSGGFRSGKTICAIIKVITQHLPVKNNRGLIGRLTYPELRDSVQKDFFKLLPEEWIENWNESKGELKLKNGTEVLFRHLDTVSIYELRGMELGFALVDQVEEIDEEIYKTLTARINLKATPLRQCIMTCNPALFWGYKYFKQGLPDTSRELIEFSMLDNKDNLPEDYLTDMLKRPENWKRQFIFGIWDESLLSEKAVFPIEYIQEQRKFVMEAVSELEGIRLYTEIRPKEHFQLGVDVSEGIGLDYSSIVGFNADTGEETCFWKGQIPPDLLTNKIIPAARVCNLALVIPEINGMGLATLSRLKDKYDNIYRRKDFDKVDNKEKEILGWKTSFATKPLLVDNFMKLLREGKLKIHSEEILNEMTTYVYSEEAKRKGMGAEVGFHDDCLMAAMLGAWNINPYAQKTPVDRLRRFHQRKAVEEAHRPYVAFKS